MSDEMQSTAGPNADVHTGENLKVESHAKVGANLFDRFAFGFAIRQFVPNFYQFGELRLQLIQSFLRLVGIF